MVSMLKHLVVYMSHVQMCLNSSSMYWIHSPKPWIDSCFMMNRFKFFWISISLNQFFFCLNRLTKVSDIHWIDSSFLWVHLKRLTHWIISFFMPCWVIFLLSESIHFILFVRKLCLFTPHYIFSLFHNSKFIESFASILSRSQKFILHTFF